MRHDLPAGIAARVAARRPCVPGRGEPTTPEGAVALVLRHTGNESRMAPPARRPALDVSAAPSRPPQGQPGCPRARVATRAGEPTVGIPTDRRRAGRARCPDLPSERP